jgi:cytochrome c5
MAENIVSYILGDHAHEGDGRRFYRLYTERPFFRDMLKAALLLHLERSVGSAAVAASGSEPRDPVDVIAALTGRYCLACHDGSIEELPNLDGDPIPREHGLSVLNAVAFEAMPKHPVVMEEHARRELVSALIAWMWPNDQLARRTARNYYGRENQPRTVQAIANALSLVRHTAGATAEDGLSWEHAEGGITPEEARFTPGFAALVGLEAVDACRDRSEPQSAAFQKCLERALQLEVLFR